MSVMKKLLIILTLLTVSYGEEMTANEFCINMAEAAEIIMVVRQFGGDITVAVEAINERSEGKLKEVYKILLVRAWEKPRYVTEENRLKAVKDFKSTTYLQCMESVDE